MTSALPRLLLAVLPLAGPPAALLAQAPAMQPVVRVAAPLPAADTAAYALPGRTEPIESARVFTRATGIVRERVFDIGDAVTAGQTLAVIAVPDLDRAVEAARAALEQAEVRAANARTLAGRSNELLASNAISREEADQRNADASAAGAAVRVAQAELARLEELQGFATVRAPFDGVVTARNFERGDRVRGDAATAEGWLYQIARLDTLRFVVGATPDLALRLATGTEGRVTFGEFPGRTFTARVARTSRAFDPATGTMRVELLLENRDLVLPAGLTGSVAFALPPPPGTWRVPTNALVLTGGRSAVAVVRDGIVAYVDVRPGRNLGAQVEVTSAALASDAAVILNPNALLRAGDRVTVEAGR